MFENELLKSRVITETPVVGTEAMPEQTFNTLSSIFPDWLKTIFMLIIAMTSSAIVSLAKSKYYGAFVFSVWVTNILLAMVMAFLVDSLALWLQPELPTRAEMAMMVISGMLARDILEIAERKGLSFMKAKMNQHTPVDVMDENEDGRRK